ncbi:MAG: hypothetical protein HRU23_12335 [Gammaproteobacteria bacterium]|nr:hypothetical protein [Gammaproteobacteria bacterium]
MMFSFFKPAPIISSSSREWIFDRFQLLIDHLGPRHFMSEAQLVLPTAKYFPSHANNPEQLAQSTLQQLTQYAGMAQWPIDLKQHHVATPLPRLSFSQGYHGESAQVINDFSSSNRIEIALDITQYPKAETLVATLSQQLSSLLLTYSEITCDDSEFIALTELLGTLLGFGVMLANTSYQFRGGCGSCYQSNANRRTGLSEEEMVYSLAIFCRLKAIDNHQVLPHLKKYLRPVFKKSLKDIAINASQFELLQQRINLAKVK